MRIEPNPSPDERLLKGFPAKFLDAMRRVEGGLLAALLLLMAVMPCAEMALRALFNKGIPGCGDYLQHMTLWLAFIGALAASRDGKHLTIASAAGALPPWARGAARFLSAFLSAMVSWGLCGAALQLLSSEAPALPQGAAAWLPAVLTRWLEPYGLFEDGSSYRVGGVVPLWLVESVMPAGFGLLAARFCVQCGGGLRLRMACALSLPLAAWLASASGEIPSAAVLGGIGLLLATAPLGTPIFILLGGSALLLFRGEGVTTAAIPSELYRIVGSQFFPTIPLFTMAGFVLSESRASQRLVPVFETLFSWLPGGSAVAITLLCAFFTTFTGASGVTILALGGVLLPVLLAGGHSERFSIGLLTATGSIGLLFPPSLVVILYAVIANIPILDMFKAGLLPGALMVVPVCAICVFQGLKLRKAGAAAGCAAPGAMRRFSPSACARAAWQAKWELLIPAVALYFIFAGVCTTVEAAAITATYALIAETLINRDLGPRRLCAALSSCGAMVGGILLVLGVAMGLTNYLVDAQIPDQAAAWAKARIESPTLFLLALNLGLLAVGCFMDIFSALMVVVPLLLPMAAAYGIHPVHLGIIFLANLQLGYLTPPVGMNLFLAAFRFDKSLADVTRCAWPHLLVMSAVVLLITYVPCLSVGMARALARHPPSSSAAPGHLP